MSKKIYLCTNNFYTLLGQYRKNKGQVATKTKCNTSQIQRIKYRKNTGYVAR